MRKIIVLILILIASSAVFAADGYTEADLTTGDWSFISGAFEGGSYSGSFRQTKTVAGSTRSFVSTGCIQITSGYGIVWYTEKPYASILAVGKDVLIQKIRDGQPTHLDMAQNPVYTQIATTLECVFCADFSVMSDTFRTFISVDGDKWSLKLIPKNKAVSSFMESMVLTGSDTFESLTLNETTGDTITYEFSDMENREPTDEELAVWSL
jgi:outer membrane lipoprotein-sorting protein